MNKIVAQIAVEAIVNDPTAYDPRDVATVRTVAVEAGVASFYVDMLPAPAESDVCAHDPNGWDCSRFVGCPAFVA